MQKNNKSKISTTTTITSFAQLTGDSATVAYSRDLVMDYLCRHPNLNEKDLEIRRKCATTEDDYALLATLEAVHLFVYCVYHGFPAERIAPEPEQSTRTFARCLCARLGDFGVSGVDPVPETTAEIAASSEGEIQGAWSFKRVLFPQAQLVPPTSRAFAIWLLAHPEGVDDSTAREWVVLRSEGDGQWLVDAKLVEAVKPFARGPLANAIIANGRIYQALVASHRDTRQMATCGTLYRDNAFLRVAEAVELAKGLDYEEDTVLEVGPKEKHKSNTARAVGDWMLLTLACGARYVKEQWENTQGKFNIFAYLLYAMAFTLTVFFPYLGLPLLIYATLQFVAGGLVRGIRDLFKTLIKGWLFGPLAIAIGALFAVLGYIAARYMTRRADEDLWRTEGGKKHHAEEESKLVSSFNAVASSICSALGFAGNQAKNLSNLVHGFESAHKVTAWIVAAYEGYISPDSRLASESTKLFVDAFGKKGVLHHDGDLHDLLKVFGCSVYTLRASAECKSGDLYHRMKRSSVRGTPTLRYLLSDSEKLTVKPQKGWLKWVLNGIPDDANVPIYFIRDGRVAASSNGQDVTQNFVEAEKWNAVLQKQADKGNSLKSKKQKRKERMGRGRAQVSMEYGSEAQQLYSGTRDKDVSDSSDPELVDSLVQIAQEIHERTVAENTSQSEDSAKENVPDADPEAIRRQFVQVPTEGASTSTAVTEEFGPHMRRQTNDPEPERCYNSGVVQLMPPPEVGTSSGVPDFRVWSTELLQKQREFFPRGNLSSCTNEQLEQFVNQLTWGCVQALARIYVNQRFYEHASQFKFELARKCRDKWFRQRCSNHFREKTLMPMKEWSAEREQRVLNSLAEAKRRRAAGQMEVIGLRLIKIMKDLLSELNTARALGLVAYPDTEMAEFKPHMRRGSSPVYRRESIVSKPSADGQYEVTTFVQDNPGEPVLVRVAKFAKPAPIQQPTGVLRGFRYEETDAFHNADEETKAWMRERDAETEKGEQECARRFQDPLYDYVWHVREVSVSTISEATVIREGPGGEMKFFKQDGRYVKVLKTARRNPLTAESGHYAWGFPRKIQKEMRPEEFEEHSTIEEKWKEWSVYGRDFGVQVAETLSRYGSWTSLHKWKILGALTITAIALIIFVWWRKAQKFEHQVSTPVRAPAAAVEKMLQDAELRVPAVAPKRDFENQVYELIYGDADTPFVPKDVHQWKSPRVPGGAIANYHGPAQMATELARAGYTDKPYKLTWLDKQGKTHSLQVRARPRQPFSTQARLMRERGHEITNEDERRMSASEGAIRRLKNQVFELQTLNPAAADTIVTLAKLELAEVVPAKDTLPELVLDGEVRAPRVDADELCKLNFRPELLGSSTRAETLIQLAPRTDPEGPNAGCLTRVAENVVLAPSHYVTHGDSNEDMLAHAKPRSAVITIGELFKDSIQVTNHKGQPIDLQICRRPEALRGHPKIPMSGSYDPPADGKTARNGWLVGINPRDRSVNTQHVVYIRSADDGMLWYSALSEPGFCGALLYDLDTGTLVGIHVGAYPSKNPHAKGKCAAAPITGEVRKQILEADAAWGVPLQQRPGVLKVQDFRLISPTNSPMG